MNKKVTYEAVFLGLTITLSIVLSILYNNYWLATLNGILGLLSIFLQAKGFFFAPLICIMDCLFYGMFSFKYNYIGEFIVYIFILIPINLYATIQWIIYKKFDKTIYPNKLGKKETIIIILTSCAILIGGYFLLNALNSEQILLNTLSMYTLAYANYLLSRRCVWGFLYYILNDIVLIALWGITISLGDTHILSFFICTIAYLICDIYGIYNWLNLKK